MIVCLCQSERRSHTLCAMWIGFILSLLITAGLALWLLKR